MRKNRILTWGKTCENQVFRSGGIEENMGERSREKAGNGEKPLPGGDAGTASFLNRFRKGDVLVGIIENDGDIVLRNQVDGADFPVRLACVPESAGQFFHLVLRP